MFLGYQFKGEINKIWVRKLLNQNKQFKLRKNSFKNYKYHKIDGLSYIN